MKNSFAVIFDMDGVLVDSNPYHKEAIKQFLSNKGFQLSDKELREKVYGRTNKDWLTAVFNGRLSEDQLEAYAYEKEALYRELFKHDIAPVAGLIPFLSQLKSFEVPMAIATSAPLENVTYSLEHTGTSTFFPVILYDRHVEKGKPEPEIYLKTADALHFPPEKCIVIEDSLSGVEAGLRAGAKVIGITTTHTPEEMSDTHLVIEDFNEITVGQLQGLIHSESRD